MTVGLVVLVALLIGANFSVMQVALDHTTPLMLTAFRLMIGGLALVVYTRWRGESIPRDPKVLLGIFVVSICITSVSSMTLVTGVSLVPAGVAALLSSLVPVWTALLAFSFLDERLGAGAVFGVGIGLVGAIILSSPAFEGETSDQLVVTGEGIDAVFLTNRMRKKFSYATLLSVEEVKEEKDEGGQDGGEEEDETETNENYPPPCPMCGTYHSPMYHHVVYDPYPNSCSIL